MSTLTITTIHTIDRLEIDNALQENKQVYFALYDTIDTLSIIKESEDTYKLIHECGSTERIVNSSISSEIIADVFIDCVLSLYNNSEIKKSYIQIN